jgi:hypothetical protein
MANIDISKLPPELQNALFQASKQQNAQPTTGGIPMEQAPAAEAPMPAPGSFKNDPQGAMNFIAQRFSQQLGQNQAGQLTQRVPVNQPLLQMLGMKKNVPVQSPDYFQAAQEHGLTLPDNLPRKPDGTPFVTEDVFQRSLSARGENKGLPNDPAIGAFGEAFLQEAGSPAQVEAWKKLQPSTQARLGLGIGGLRTKRQDAFGQTEVLGNGDAVQKNINDGKYYYAGTQIPYDKGVDGQQLPRVAKTMSDSTAIQLGKTQTLLNSIDLAEQSIQPEKFGLWQGTFNKTIASYTNKDPQAAAMFRQLKTVFTEVTHDLYGGTLTGHELDQATDLLFNQYQSAEAVKAALGVQRDKLSNRLENISGLLKAGNIKGADAVKPTTPKSGAKSKASPVSQPETKRKSLNDIFGKP